MAAWMANSRIRWSESVICWVPDSAICSIAKPSLALRWAMPLPRIWERNPSDTESPAASSEERLIRIPVESRSSDFCIRELVKPSVLWVATALMLL